MADCRVCKLTREFLIVAIIVVALYFMTAQG